MRVVRRLGGRAPCELPAADAVHEVWFGRVRGSSWCAPWPRASRGGAGQAPRVGRAMTPRRAIHRRGATKGSPPLPSRNGVHADLSVGAGLGVFYGTGSVEHLVTCTVPPLAALDIASAAAACAVVPTPPCAPTESCSSATQFADEASTLQSFSPHFCRASASALAFVIGPQTTP